MHDCQMARRSGAIGGGRMLPQEFVNSKLGFRVDSFEMLQCEGHGARGRLLFKANRNKTIPLAHMHDSGIRSYQQSKGEVDVPKRVEIFKNRWMIVMILGAPPQCGRPCITATMMVEQRSVVRFLYTRANNLMYHNTNTVKVHRRV